MKSIFNTFILMLISLSLFAQQDSILTKANNAAWLENFKKIETKAEQIEAIKAKIIADTSYIIPIGLSYIGVDRSKIGRRKYTKPLAECKPLFMLNGQVLNSDYYENPMEILRFLNKKTVNEINLYVGDNITAIYGTRAQCGVIIITSENKRIKRKLKRLVKKREE